MTAYMLLCPSHPPARTLACRVWRSWHRWRTSLATGSLSCPNSTWKPATTWRWSRSSSATPSGKKTQPRKNITCQKGQCWARRRCAYPLSGAHVFYSLLWFPISLCKYFSTCPIVVAIFSKYTLQYLILLYRLGWWEGVYTEWPFCRLPRDPNGNDMILCRRTWSSLFYCHCVVRSVSSVSVERPFLP